MKKEVIITIACAYGEIMNEKLSAYCDDSGSPRVFAFAGIVGTPEEWEAIKPAWLSYTKGRDFHASDCDLGHGDYKDIPKEARDEEYKNLTAILADKSNLYGFGVSVDIAAITNNLPETIEDAPYFSCLMRVICGLAERGYLSKPQRQVMFNFDNNMRRKYNTIRMLELLSQWPYCEYGKYIDTTDQRFLSHIHPEIQAACLLARETMKHLDSKLTKSGRPIRKSLKRLLDSNRFICRMYSKGYFEAIAKIMKENADKFNSANDDYRQFLSVRRIDDNNTNRISYLLSSIPPEKIV